MSESPTSLLLILGKTRVGKGEFIKTAIEKYNEEEPPENITSRGLESHTRESSRYPLHLNGRDISLVDTVGFDDSEGDDRSTEAFLKLLAETGREELYPPVVILRDLSGSSKEWLRRIQSVFSSVVCAVRCSDPDDFQSLKEEWLNSDRAKVPLFHLQEFFKPKFDGGRTRDLYISNVVEIVDFCSKLPHNRANLDFDSDIFQGAYDRVYVDKQTVFEDTPRFACKTCKADEVIKRQKVIVVEKKEENKGFLQTLFEAISTFLFGKKTVVVEDSDVREITVSYVEKKIIRCYYTREAFEIWKVLAGGIRIFKMMEYDDKTKIGEETVDVQIEEISASASTESRNPV